MNNQKLKAALNSAIKTAVEDVEVSDNELDGVAGGCNLLIACGAYSEPAPQPKPKGQVQ